MTLMPLPAEPVEPKQSRARATRLKLLDAAVAELAETGYRGLTTLSVARRAGVSRGAQQNYFPHKRTLVVEAIHHLAQRQIDELGGRVEATAQGRARLQVALDILFEQYSGRLFAAVIELSLAARSEPELLDVVGADERAISRAINDIAVTIFGEEVTAAPAFAERWATALSAVRGLALLKLLGHPAPAVDRQWAATRRELILLLSEWV
jgi:AcrR family transcriptional regulator